VLRVGLTGGIGSGKSEVSRRLAAHGAIVIDSDLLAREVVEPGTDGLAEVAAEFGSSVLGADGRLDRAVLAERVFADADARRRLERIVHPRVRARAAELERTAPPGAVVVHDIPLLVETGRAADFDVVVVVDLDEEDQLRRLVASRGVTVEEARARISAQATRAQRVAAADVVIDNSGTLDDLEAAVTDLWRALRQRGG
jgi:dephospho-CoA kinase